MTTGVASEGLRRFAAKFACLAVLVLGAGCVPSVGISTPAIQGRVVDEAGQPVANASVSVQRSYERGKRIAEMHTNARGEFSRSEDAILLGYLIWPDIGGMVERYTVTARANGAECSRFVEVANQNKPLGIGKSNVADFGTMTLTPATVPSSR